MTSSRIISLALAAVLTGASPAAAEPAPSTTLKIPAARGPVSERVTLGVGSAAVIELPVEARDVLVSNPQVADAIVRTPQRIFVLGQAAGQTNAFFFDANGRQILNLEISVSRGFPALNADMSTVTPESDLRAQGQGEGVVIGGQARDARDVAAARSLAQQAAGADKVAVEAGIVKTDQVLLKVRIAEMQRTVAKQLGVDLEASFRTGAVPFDLQTSNPFSLLGRALSPDSRSTIGNAAQNNIQGTIRALERVGLMRTLAEPNLTAISGEAARFLAGGEFPVPVSRDRDGNVQIEFKPFGVGLAFTPVVVSEGRISLRISTEVSELTGENAFVSGGANGLTIPGLNVRRAETTVELPSGGSLVIAGLLQQSSRNNADGYPGLKNVPVLGQLFSSRDFQNKETELVVLVTPYLVDPVREAELRAPTDGFAQPSDADLYLMNRLHAVYPAAAGRAETKALARSAGFIVQ